MDVQTVVKNVTEQIQNTANVRAVFGEPITADGMTLIPVACVKVSGGGGGGRKAAEGDAGKDTGMGLGVSVTAAPVGFIEIRDGEARMVDIVDKNKIGMAGMVVGGLLLLTAAKLAVWKVRRRG